VFNGDKNTKEKVMFATVCDACAAKAAAIPRQVVNPTQEDRRRKMWVGMTGIRYSDFRAAELPTAIQSHAEKVLAWEPQPKGIGLVGPSRVGKSPLIYALGQSLFVAGIDVMPTSGLEFQRKFHRAIEHREQWETYLKDCEDCEVLLIDDADKLNLTAGVEAEYYGMLEHRRNWQRPVLCTLNLTGPEFAALGRDRSDRSAAIVERPRDLCEFIQIEA
jgi:DNA replication protein DnaC